MKLTTLQIATTAIIIAVAYGLIRIGLEIITLLIETPSTHLAASLILVSWITLLAIIILARLLRATSDIHLTDLDYQPHDFEHNSLSSFTSYPGRHDNIIRTAEQITADERKKQQCPAKANGKQLAKKFGPLGETLN